MKAYYKAILSGVEGERGKNLECVCMETNGKNRHSRKCTHARARTVKYVIINVGLLGLL